MSSNTGDAVAERQREREGRGLRRLGSSRGSDAPRQRRPALAALALLLIVGGALAAGLLAVRMDSRVPVIVAREDIPPGAEITEEMLAEAQVASDVLETIGAGQADQVVGTYATAGIPANSLVSERDLAAESPVGEGNAVVGLSLAPGLTYDDVQAGDLVRIYRVTGEAGSTDGGTDGGEDGGEGSTSSGSGAVAISQGLVLSVARPDADELGGGSAPTASLLVPAEVAGDVIDASSATAAGLALELPDQPTDTELAVAEEAP